MQTAERTVSPFTRVLRMLASCRVSSPPQSVLSFTDPSDSFIHLSVFVTACHNWFNLSNVKHRVFLLRSKVNMKEIHGLTTANMDSGFSFGVGRNLDSCSICTDQVRNWGSKCHFSTFYFILFCVIYISNDGSVIFTVLFGTFLNLMYCMVVFLHVYWI